MVLAKRPAVRRGVSGLRPADLIRGGFVNFNFVEGRVIVAVLVNAGGSTPSLAAVERATVTDDPAVGYGLTGVQVIAGKLMNLLGELGDLPQADDVLTTPKRDALVYAAVASRPGLRCRDYQTAVPEVGRQAVANALERMLKAGRLTADRTDPRKYRYSPA